MLIQERAKTVEAYVIAARRRIHEFAELSGQEHKTREFIEREMAECGIPFERLTGTGIVGILDTGKPGPGIALRADMDALPMKEHENNLKQKRTCMSSQENTAHACGHDAHVAMLLGTMKVLADKKDELTGVIYFCFEEGEEYHTGIAAMMAFLAGKKIDTVWGIHVYSALESGKISVDEGPRMSGAAGVELTFVGKGGHGSRPDLSANPVFCAANFLNNLAVAFANQIDVSETVTLGITSISSDPATNAGNIIGDRAKVVGSMRFFNTAIGQKAVDLYRHVADCTAKMHKCQVEFGSMARLICNPVINDSECSRLAKSALEELLPSGSLASCGKWYGSESFSYYSEKYKSVFAFLGIKNPEYGSGAEHHNEYFDVDENVLSLGVTATIGYVTAYVDQYANR